MPAGGAIDPLAGLPSSSPTLLIAVEQSEIYHKTERSAIMKAAKIKEADREKYNYQNREIQLSKPHRGRVWVWFAVSFKDWSGHGTRSFQTNNISNTDGEK